MGYMTLWLKSKYLLRQCYLHVQNILLRFYRNMNITNKYTNIKSSMFCSLQSTWGTAPSLWCRPWRGGPCPGCWCMCRCSRRPPGSRPPAAQSWSPTRPRPGQQYDNIYTSYLLLLLSNIYRLPRSEFQVWDDEGPGDVNDSEEHVHDVEQQADHLEHHDGSI